MEVLDKERAARKQLLGDHDHPIDVQFDLLPAPCHNAEGAGTSGQLQKIVDYYRDLRPGRLVITGAPGSGKMVLRRRTPPHRRHRLPVPAP
ncbi:hypothetical protein [Streptomyces sp. NPDC019890]|uniref:hypothetical protein n=1 Tax=Streptomyces sp. NPDC019890 TaxID=3365064 RepID=UPI00384E5DF8